MVQKHDQPVLRIGTNEESELLSAELDDEGAKSAEKRLRIVKEASSSRLSQQRTWAIARLYV